MTDQILVQGGEASHWEQAIYAFLAEKERRSGSMRTVQAYSRMLFQFFGAIEGVSENSSYTESIGCSSFNLP